MSFKGFFGRFVSGNLSADGAESKPQTAAPQQAVNSNTMHISANRKAAENTAGEASADNVFRPKPAEPDRDVPSNYVPYEGEDMTCAEASAAGFEFVGADRYHGADGWLGKVSVIRSVSGEIVFISRRGGYNGAGVSGCAVTGFRGKNEIVKIPRSINGRPVVKIEKKAFRFNENIREIYLPDSVIDIGDCAFESCRSLAFARLSANLAHIGMMSFICCTALERVYLGNVGYIDKFAFCGCERLSSVRLSDETELLGNNVFADTGLKALYWKKITCCGNEAVSGTPYEREHSVILLGDCLQKCSVSVKGEIVIDDPGIKVIGSHCFSETSAEKVTLSEKVSKIESGGFGSKDGYRIDEIYAPRLFIIGERCFSKGQKINISTKAEYVTFQKAEPGYLRIEEDSFIGTDMERFYPGGSDEKPCVCVMVRKILERVEEADGENPVCGNMQRGILTLSEDGSTLTMDDSVEHTAAERIPTLGAKRLILSRNLHSLRSFNSVNDFKEIVIGLPALSICENPDDIFFYMNRSITLRFKYNYENWGGSVDSSYLLYLPPAVGRSEEAERLRKFYAKCLKNEFTPSIYDGEILDLVSSYRARFTIARLRLEGGHFLKHEAKERYESFLLLHKRKAEFTAKKYGDKALLALLEKISREKTVPKG